MHFTELDLVQPVGVMHTWISSRLRKAVHVLQVQVLPDKNWLQSLPKYPRKTGSCLTSQFPRKFLATAWAP